MNAPRRRRKVTLARQLVGWFLLLTLLPLGLLTFVASRNARTLLTREATNGLLAIAERQAHQIESYVREREKTATALSRTPSIADRLARANARLEELESEDLSLRSFLAEFQESSGWDNILLVSLDGDVVVSLARSSAAGTNLKRGPYAASGLAKVCDRALMLMGTEISELAYDPTANRPASYAATPVFREGVVVGVLALEMSKDEINLIVNDATGLGQTGETIVAARDGNDAVFMTPVRNDPAAAFKRRVPLASMAGSSLAEVVRGRIRRGRAVDYRGERVLAVWSDIPHLGWYMMVKIDEAEAFKPVARFRLLSTLVEAPLFAIVLLAALSVARAISGPIVRLTGATQAFASGDHARRAKLETHNEIRTLAASFNQMGAKLQASIAELERYGRTLEGRVADRTAELVEKNAELEEALGSLKRAQEQILLQEKMASLGSLTAGIAHEIKNPLNFVNNFAILTGELLVELGEELEREKGKLDPKVADDMQALIADLRMNAAKVLEHGRRADGIVKSMLLHARGRTGERQETDLNALLTESVNLAYHAMRGMDSAFNVKIESVLDPKTGSIDAVPQDLSRVFLNLFNNACYSVNERRKSEKGDYTPLLSVRSRGDEDGVEVKVRDNGIGIPKAVMERVFTPFFTTKPAGSGTGLGLSISYDIVTEGHGGTLSVETEEGRFAEFTVKLPRAAAVGRPRR